MKCASFNVLADAYIGYGDYSHADPELLLPNARTEGIVSLINSLDVDIAGLQEVETPLLQALDQAGGWQTLWSPKSRSKPDGCLTIVRHGIEVEEFDAHHYTDGSGHIAQVVRIGQTIFANTHIKWAPAGTPLHAHPGNKQAAELLELLGPEQPAVIFADINDMPGGPVRGLIERAGFVNTAAGEPTALVNQEPVAIDLLAVRGIAAAPIIKDYDVKSIPSAECPSDHKPLVAQLFIN